MEIKVGDRFTTNKGGDVVVVEYVRPENITVEFMDLHKHRVVTRKATLLEGVIKNPYSPVVFGVGYIGTGIHKAKDGSSRLGFGQTQSYRAWMNMLSRCYASGYDNREGYAHVTVDENWHNYQNFAEWYGNQVRNNKYNGKLNLDKDILSDDFVYSASTCCVVPDVINCLVTSKCGGRLLLGVRQTSKKNYRVIPGYTCSNIRFSSETEAHLAYVEVKSNKIREVAIDYKQYLSPEVFNALMTRDFRYKFSPLFEPGSRVILH